MALTYKHILLIRLSALGDVAMTVPVISSLVEKYPDLKLTIVSRKFAAPLFEGIPRVDFLEADVYGKHRGTGLLQLANEARALHIDAVADLHNVIRSRIITAYLRLRGLTVETIDKGRSEKAALIRRETREIKPLKSTIARYCEVFDSLGAPIEIGELKPLPKRDAGPRIRQLFEGPKTRAIGIAPFAAYKSKAYPLELMKQVIDKLDESGSFQVFLFGGGEQEVEALSALARSYRHVVNIAGQLTMTDELSLISNLDLMVSMDSSNGHLAAMFGVPVVTIWGVTHPAAGFAPFGQPETQQLIPDLKQFPLIPTSVYGNKFPEGYQKAIASITPEAIVEKINEVLG
jgi:ADP-heptose:LPS heptosyltransferase